MKVARNLQDFYYLNDKDVDRLLHKHFKNILNRFSVEDIKNEIYERLISKNYIEDYRPFRIYVDEKNSIWEFKKAEAKFSTYIFTFMKNYILAYYGNMKPYESWESLDEYNDNGYCSTKDKRINFKEDSSIYMDYSNFKIDLNDFINKLERRSKNKGTFICKSNKETAIVSFLDYYGEKGCDFNKFIESMNDEGLFKDSEEFNQTINSLKERGFIKYLKIEGDNERVALDNPLRRSLYNLFIYYLEGYKDKEISEKFNMTVAGVGALKRGLRKEMQFLAKNWKDKD